MNYLKNLCILVLLLYMGAFICAQTPEVIEKDVDINWETGELHLTAYMQLPVELMPTAKAKAQKELHRYLPELFIDSVKDIRINSTHSVSDAIYENPNILNQLTELALSEQPNSSTLTGDLTTLRVEFRYTLAQALLSIFIEHTDPYRPFYIAPYEPSDSYTGILIYAADPLPEHGKLTKTNLVPSLKPEIYSESMISLLSAEMQSPELLNKQGVLGYTYTTEESAYSHRIGLNPLRIRAEKVFGTTPTNIIISETDAGKILSRMENLQLLYEGKVVVIIPE